MFFVPQSHKGTRGRMNRGFALWDGRPTYYRMSHIIKEAEAI